MNKIYQQKMERYSEEYVFENCEREREVPLVKDAYQNGWHNALQNQWISVDEALPEIKEYVLAMNEEGLSFVTYRYDSGEICNPVPNTPITHWMSIPELKGGEE